MMVETSHSNYLLDILRHGLDIMRLDVLGLDILGLDILGLDILGTSRKNNTLIHNLS